MDTIRPSRIPFNITSKAEIIQEEIIGKYKMFINYSAEIHL